MANKPTRLMPMGNPADYPIGSPESRAAARAMLEAMPVDIASLSDYELTFAIAGYYLKATNRARRFSGNRLSRQEFIAAATDAAIEDKDLRLDHWPAWPRKAITPEERRQVAGLCALREWNSLEDMLTGGPEWFGAPSSWGNDQYRPFLSAVIVDTKTGKLIPVPAADEVTRIVSGSQREYHRKEMERHLACGWTVKECTDERDNFRAVMVKKIKNQVQ